MASRTSPPIPQPLWRHPQLGEPGGPSFGIAEAVRRARSWKQKEDLIQRVHRQAQDLYASLRDLREWEPPRSPARQNAEAAYEAAQADLAAALQNAYHPDFRSAFDALHEGRPADPTPLIAFLEADPYFFGSGYAKESVLRLLKRCDLTPSQEERLRVVILNAVQRPEWRREFRRYARLARKVEAPAFRAALLEIEKNGNLGERIRARWVLETLGIRLPRTL
jgi:hypothetical protein